MSRMERRAIVTIICVWLIAAGVALWWAGDRMGVWG
jgi:hypothetical protein